MACTCLVTLVCLFTHGLLSVVAQRSSNAEMNEGSCENSSASLLQRKTIGHVGKMLHAREEKVSSSMASKSIKADLANWQFEYTLVEGKNCYGSNGVNIAIHESGELTLEQCKASCSEDLTCQGIQVTIWGQSPKCWVKSTMNADACDTSTWSNVWVRSKYPIGIDEVKFHGTTLMHIMPWFGFREDGAWTSHWTMSLPEDSLRRDGRVAAHLTPLIGPYASSDSQVVYWQLNMMKLAGVDGVVIDWYGTRNHFDFPFNLLGADEIVEQASALGMNFTICYEDWTTTAGSTSWGEEPTGSVREDGLNQMQADFEYIRDNYLSKPGFLIDSTGSPVILVFGPRTFQQDADWAAVLSNTFSGSQTPSLFSLAYTEVGDGRFSWLGALSNYATTAENEAATLESVGEYLTDFYNDQSALGRAVIGSAFPGYQDYYVEGEGGESYGMLPDYDGRTLDITMKEAKMHQPPFLQLATWNDYSEGTSFEPTKELLGTAGSHFHRLLELQQLLLGYKAEQLFVNFTCTMWCQIAYSHSDWPAPTLCEHLIGSCPTPVPTPTPPTPVPPTAPPTLVYTLVEGKNCYGSNGVNIRIYGSGKLTLEECKASCSEDLACKGIQVTTHGNEKPKCWVKSTINLDKCATSTWSDVWVREQEETSDFFDYYEYYDGIEEKDPTSEKEEKDEEKEEKEEKEEVTEEEPYTLVKGKNCYGRNGVNIYVYGSGELTMEKCKEVCSQDSSCQGIQVTSFGSNAPKCWVKSTINIDECDASTWSDVWIK